MLESSQLQGRDPSLQDSASDGGAGGAGRRGMELKEGMEERFILFVRAAQQVKHHLLKKNTYVVWLPCLSDDWGVEQGLAEGEALTGDTPATRLSGGPGEDEGEGLDRELRHLETEEGRQEPRRGAEVLLPSK